MGFVMTPGGAEMSVSRSLIFLKSVNGILDLLATRGIETPPRCAKLTARFHEFADVSIWADGVSRNRKPYLWLTFHRANAMDHS